MSDQTPTPRTDARLPKCTLEAKVVSADFARQLERELAAAIAERDEARGNTERFRSSIKPPECPCDPDNGTPFHDHPDCPMRSCLAAPTSDPEAAAKCATVAIYTDQIDSALPETEFWKSLDDGSAPFSMDVHPHNGEGGSTTALFLGANLVGVSTAFRDEYNRTVLVCVDLRGNELARLRAEVQALREDKAMLDWMASRLDHPHYWEDLILQWDHEDGVWLSTIRRGEYLGAKPMECSSYQPTLRDAIRAAMRKENAKLSSTEEKR